MNILEEAKKVFDIEIESLVYLRDNLDDEFMNLVQLIQQSSGRVIITGMGKSGHIGRKIAATMSSLGTVSYFLHPAEGLHGDLGQITKDDIVIALSYSGQSDEVIGLISSIKKIGAKLVSITGKPNSLLEQSADLSIILPIISEASTYKLAPTTSTTAALVFGDALAVVLSKLNNFTPEDFAIFHPSGALGKKLLLDVDSLMNKNGDNPIVNHDTNLKEAIMVMSSKGLGGVSIVNDEGKLVGLLTDGDLRRIIEKNNDINFLNIKVKDVMTVNPIAVNKSEKAVRALEVMENRKRQISILPVIDDEGYAIGMIRLHDIIRAGII